MATATSTYQNKLPQNSCFENRNNFHDASFSSYLKGADESMFVRKLTTESNQIQNKHEHVSVGKKKVEEGEIGVFGAEKYFKGAMDDENPRITRKSVTEYDIEKDEANKDSAKTQPGTQPGTPSVYSESSWNSQNALMHHIPRSLSRKSTKKAQRKSFFANIGCNCYCNDKKSVNIEDNHISEGKPPMKNGKNKSLSKTWAEEEIKKSGDPKNVSKREDHFSFPIVLQEEGKETKTRRNSREVFGSPILEKGSKSFSLERKLTLLSWDNPKLGGYNDTESDASSDLFEIESFSTNPNPTNSYAPSEASIAWSVVTASVADTEDVRMAALTKNQNKMVTNKEVHKRRTGFISGCKSQKAVRVVGDAGEPDPFTCKPITRSQPNSAHMLYTL